MTRPTRAFFLSFFGHPKRSSVCITLYPRGHSTYRLVAATFGLHPPPWAMMYHDTNYRPTIPRQSSTLLRVQISAFTFILGADGWRCLIQLRTEYIVFSLCCGSLCLYFKRKVFLTPWHICFVFMMGLYFISFNFIPQNAHVMESRCIVVETNNSTQDQKVNPFFVFI